MTGADKVVCQAATLLLLFALTSMPAKAQFAGMGGVTGAKAPMMPYLSALRCSSFGRPSTSTASTIALSALSSPSSATSSAIVTKSAGDTR